MKTKIYFLRDENRFVRYVGKTTKPLEKRLKAHLQEARRGKINHRCNGIRALLRKGSCPTIDLITEVEGNGDGAERAYIKWLRSKGVDLWNGSDGGEGNPGWVATPEIRKKFSEARLASPYIEETRKRLKWFAQHQVCSEATREKHRQHKHSEETKRKIGDRNRGKTISIETRQKIRQTRLGTHLSENAKRKLRLALTGRIFSKQHRTNLSIAKRKADLREKINKQNCQTI